VKIYLGTQGWSYKDWVGALYPARTVSREYLVHYAQEFDAVELDTTFYGTPRPDRIQLWDRSTPAHFQFAAKTPRTVTHDRRLVDAQEDFNEFLDVMSGLGTKLGAILIQLPPDFTTAERPELEAFVRRLPADFRFAVEFRHRSWLTDDTYDFLRLHHVAWTMIDLVYMPRQIECTADFTYVRWLGDRRKIQRMHETQIDRRPDLEAWAEQLENVAHRLERMYGFVNNHYSGHSPADVRFLKQRLHVPDMQPEIDRPEQGTLL
jgi:uncharacterized protein YecE (DUF72 family)